MLNLHAFISTPRVQPPVENLPFPDDKPIVCMDCASHNLLSQSGSKSAKRLQTLFVGLPFQTFAIADSTCGGTR